jgi:hypothetical protein
MLLCAAGLTALLVIGGVEQNPGPGVEVVNSLQLLCSGCEGDLKSGTQCDMYGRWFHNSCGNVKVQMADSRKWSYDRCRWDRFHRLEEKLENTLQQIEELKWKNKGLEEQLRGAVAGFEVGRCDTVRRQDKGSECLVLGDSITWNVESEHMRVQCFPGIRTEQLQRVMENRDLESPDTVVIHVGTNDLIRTEYLYYVMGDMYALVNKAKTKIPKSRLVLSGVLRHRYVSWRRIGALNSRYDRIAKTLGVTFVDSNSWIENWDFCRDGLHINRSGARRLSQLYSRVCGFGSGGQNSKE